MYKNPTKRLPLELPEEEHKALRQMALDKGTSATKLIRECLHSCYPDLAKPPADSSKP